MKKKDARMYTPQTRKQTAKNVRARKLLENSQKILEKKALLFRDEPYVTPPPLVPRVQLKQPTKVLISKSVRDRVMKGLKTVQKEVTVSSWPADQMIRLATHTKVQMPILKIPEDHDDSDTE